MAYSNILSRRMNREFVNLGFSGNGRGEPALARLMNQIEGKAMVVLDYQANAGESIRETLGPFIDELRKADSSIPILVISKIRYAKEMHDPSLLESVIALSAFQQTLVELRRKKGDKNLYFLDGATLLASAADECTVDGVHPTDLGFMRMAEGIEPVIRSILNDPED